MTDRFSLPFLRFAAAALAALALPAPATAQLARPWLDWQTVETEHFVFHFPESYRTWTNALAERMEGVREQVARIVGFTPSRRVDIVVDDPANDANGTAFTPLDAPTIVLWPTPPNPREEIGNFRLWGELLATHEFAHVAHLARPTRNRLRRLFWSLSPVPLGPIAANAPRWAIEGYATYVEGKVTGTGRPNHAWRAAILRQFALEGRLPSYGALNATGGWETGSFAYLAGSAYFEWLARREGDSSVTALWKRMTATTTRSFDEAFVGVYGGGPAELYSRFAAEMTADAVSFERALARGTLVPGTLVQRLSRSTGDPAVSPDGRFVALLVRRAEVPSRLVVWRTADEPDTLFARRREEQRQRDPDDVPDRSFYPAPKRAVISLVATDGAPYESPRWLPDNRRLLVTRRVPLGDGSLRSDLFIWNAEDNTLSRVTSGAGIRDPDPSIDGRWAAAVRCDRGWCDLVRVDLNTGAVRVIVSGSVLRNFYRPRVSRRSGEIVVSEQTGDRWRIAVVNPDNGVLRYADPDDGATRYDATFDVDGRTIIATSELGGIANLERLAADSRTATRLSAVTGAAVAADVAPDGTLWFLSLHASGYDVRTLRPDNASITRANNVAAIASAIDTLSPVLPPRTLALPFDSTYRPRVSVTGDQRPYEIGPSRYRYLPGFTAGYGGESAQLSIVRSDPVGRVGVSLLLVAGSSGLPAGFATELTTRELRTVVTANLWGSHEAPSGVLFSAVDVGLDLARYGGALRFQRRSADDAGDHSIMLGMLGERQLATSLPSANRAAAIGMVHVNRRQRDESTRYQEQLWTLGEFGTTDGGTYVRQRSSVFFGTATGSRALATARVSYGTIGGKGGFREQFVIGGFASPLLDPVLDARRVESPAYPVGSAASKSFTAWRLALPYEVFEVFYAGATPDLFRTSLRSWGLEVRRSFAAIPPLGTPEVNVLAGFARAVDAPVKKAWRYYVAVAVKP